MTWLRGYSTICPAAIFQTANLQRICIFFSIGYEHLACDLQKPFTNLCTYGLYLVSSIFRKSKIFALEVLKMKTTIYLGF